MGLSRVRGLSMKRVQHGKGATTGKGVRGGATTQVPRFSPRGDPPVSGPRPLYHPKFILSDSPGKVRTRDYRTTSSTSNFLVLWPILAQGHAGAWGLDSPCLLFVRSPHPGSSRNEGRASPRKRMGHVAEVSVKDAKTPASTWRPPRHPQSDQSPTSPGTQLSPTPR